jgi:hypothetical protein
MPVDLIYASSPASEANLFNNHSIAMVEKVRFTGNEEATTSQTRNRLQIFQRCTLLS